MEKQKMDLYENYIKQASKYLNEGEDEEFDLDVDAGDEEAVVDEVPADDGDAEGDEVLELDLSNPVCPSCGAQLIPVGDIDTTEEDEDGNPVYEQDEADAIDLLQSLGYVIYKPATEDEDFDDEGDEDFDTEDTEDFDEEDTDEE